MSNESASIEQEHQDPGVSEPTTRSMGFPYLDVVLLVLCSAVIIASFLMKSEGPSEVFLPGSDSAMPDICAMKRTFGIGCPGCGLTRAFISISSANMVRAWAFNPASFLVYALVVFQIPWRSYLFFRWTRKQARIELPMGIPFVVTMAIALVSQWIIRMTINLL